MMLLEAELAVCTHPEELEQRHPDPCDAFDGLDLIFEDDQCLQSGEVDSCDLLEDFLFGILA